MIAAKIANLEQGAQKTLPKNRQRLNLKRRRSSSSRGSVQNAKKVLDAGTPELVEAVRDGVISVGAATDVATLPRDEQRDVVKQVENVGEKPGSDHQAEEEEGGARSSARVPGTTSRDSRLSREGQAHCRGAESGGTEEHGDGVSGDRGLKLTFQLERYLDRLDERYNAGQHLSTLGILDNLNEPEPGRAGQSGKPTSTYGNRRLLRV